MSAKSPVIEVIEPATEEVMAEVPEAGAEDVDAAVSRAKAAFPAWRAMAPADRSKLLHVLADALTDKHEELSVLEARNAGKPIANARGEIGMVAECFRYYAGGVERLTGKTIPVAGGVDMTFREPMGVIGMITPWNFPLVIASWKVAPALAAANTIVLKPAALTPLTAIELEKIALDAGLPEGVLNVVARPRVGLRPATGRAPRRGQDRLHGINRGGRGHRARRRRHDQARDAGAGRQVRQRRLRRRRHRAGSQVGALRRLRQLRPGLLRALADHGGAPRA